jgi:hexosaminidase
MRSLLTSIFLLIVIAAYSQPADLKVKWEIIENNHDNKPQSLSSLTFITQHKLKLPKNGWRLYFNFANPIVAGSVTGGLTFSHVNGDLFYLSPSSTFTGINANDSLKITFLSAAWLINVTDAPQGFYLIYDAHPNVYFLVSNVKAIPSSTPKQYMRSPIDKVEPGTPQILYEQNKSIEDISEDSLVKIFPTPLTYHLNKGHFLLQPGTNVIADVAFKPEAAYLNSELNTVLSNNVSKRRSTQVIKLVKDVLPLEAYRLTITPAQITITASSGSGIFNGIQSLKMLMPPQAYSHAQNGVLLPCLTVTDEPRFSYRALMLDVARNFQQKSELIKLLDVMALYKLNVLHLHLNDDEGWRLQITSLPELTTIGALRGHTLDGKFNLPPSDGSGPDIHNLHGSGYYSTVDFIEILKYATVRHIAIVPEIESPGHARAAIKSMDARYRWFMQKGLSQKANQYMLHDMQDTSRYTSVQYWNDNVMDVALPSTYNFIETVTGGIQQLYKEAGAPLSTIHFGGDEVPAGAWEKSPAVLSLMKRDSSIKTVDDLWGYYYNRVDNILKRHNLYLTAWEEAGTKKAIVQGRKQNVINTGLINKNIHLEVWNNVLGWGAEDLAYKLANSGYKVILSCVSNLYFDMAYTKAFKEPGYYWGGYADVDKPFSFIPYHYFKNTTVDRMGVPLNPAIIATKEKLSAVGKANIVGLQGALWGETLKTAGRLEYMLLPKMLGLAERAWSKDPDWATETDTVKSKAMYNMAWSRFVNVLGKQELPRLAYYHGGYTYRIPQPGAIIKAGAVVANTQLPGLIIRYTTNGEEPTLNSATYKVPIQAKGVIKLRAFNQAGAGGQVIAIENN